MRQIQFPMHILSYTDEICYHEEQKNNKSLTSSFEKFRHIEKSL